MSERLLRLRDVMAQTGLGSSTIYRYMAAGTFPKQVKIGGYSARWLASEVDGWIEQLKMQHNNDAARPASRKGDHSLPAASIQE